MKGNVSRAIRFGHVVGLLAGLLATAGVWAGNVPVSNWMRDLTAAPAGAEDFREEGAEMVVVSNTVHLVWVNRITSLNVARLYYMRSTDGGGTFEPKQLLLELAGWSALESGADLQRLAVDGENVHVAVEAGGNAIAYFRSASNGHFFEPVRSFGGLVEISNVRVAAHRGQVTMAYGRIYRDSFMGGLLGARPFTLNSSDGGATFGAPVLASQYDQGYEGVPRDLLCVSNRVYVLAYASAYDYARLEGTLGFALSTNAGTNFSLATLSLPSANGSHQADSLHDLYYAPNLAVAGERVHVAWTGLDGQDVNSLFYVASTNRGQTLTPAVNLTAGWLGTNESLVSDHIALAAQGQSVYVAYSVEPDWSIWLRRSTNAGATFDVPVRLTAAPGVPLVGWGDWPVFKLDPADPTGQKVYLLWRGEGPVLVVSSNGGATFSPPVVIGLTFSWAANQPRDPRLEVGEGGVLHNLVIGQVGSTGNWDLYYRQVTPPPPPAVNTSLSLSQDPTLDRYDHFSLPAYPGLRFSNQFTVEFWVQPDSDASSQSALLAQSCQGEAAYRFFLDNDRPRCELTTGDGTFPILGPTPLPRGSWTHLAATFDALAATNNFILFVNGRPAATNTVTGPFAFEPGLLMLGGYQNYFTRTARGRGLFTGRVDELRLWTRVRPAGEILADRAHPLAGTESGLAAYYSFDQTPRDLTGRSQEGWLMYMESYSADVPFGNVFSGHDHFTNRATLSGAPWQPRASNATASKEPGEPNHGGDPGGHSLWWSWSSPVAGELTLTTAGSDFDTLLAVYTGGSLGSLAVVDSQDAGQADEVIRFHALANTPYAIAVDGYGGATGQVVLNLAFQASPPNDDFAQRAILSGADGTVRASNVAASKEPGETNRIAGYEAGRSLWWSWQAPAVGRFTVTTAGSELDTLLSVWTGSTLGTLSCVAQQDNGQANESISIQTLAGTSYAFAVDAYRAATGQVVLNWSFLLSPSNDHFANRRVLSGEAISLVASNVAATLEPGEPRHAGKPTGSSLWWSWTPPASGPTRISTLGAAFDTVLAVYTGDTLSNLTMVAANDAALGDAVEFDALGGTSYQIAVAGYNGLEGTFPLLLRHSDHTALATSAFGLDADFWTVVSLRDGDEDTYDVINGGPYPALWDTTNGNPGGCIYYNHFSSGTWYFQAPAAFLGDHSACYGGSLKFDAAQAGTGTAFAYGDVVLLGTNLTLVRETPAPPGFDWTPFVIPLQETAGWRKGNLLGAPPTRAEFQEVLRSLTALRIRGEYRFGAQTAWLDNVALTPPETGEAPVLSIRLAEDRRVVLSWPTTATGYALEATARLGTSWQPVDLAPTQAGDQLTVTLEASQAASFYRLKK